MEITLSKKRKGFYKKCERCSKSFYVLPSQKNRRFCSRECSKNREFVTCICGKVFLAHKSSNRKFCSPECANKAAKGRKAHPNVIKAIKKRKLSEKEINNQKGLNKHDLIESVINKKISPPELAKMIGVSHATVLNRMREYRITPEKYPELVEIRKAHKAKGNLNRTKESKESVTQKISEYNRLRWTDIEFKKRVSKKISIARDSKVDVECSHCGKVKRVSSSHAKKNENFFCDEKCRAAFLSDGNAWNYLAGGASYDAYFDKISFAEKIRRAKDDERILEAACAYCGRWFKPTGDQLEKRVKALKGFSGGVSKLYCSYGCKKVCPIYKQVKYPKGFRRNTSREVVPELRQIVFKRDNWSCQICELSENLHCHHISGYTQNKILANDPDNCITLCKTCHNEVHKLPGCGYQDLKCD